MAYSSKKDSTWRNHTLSVSGGKNSILTKVVPQKKYTDFSGQSQCPFRIPISISLLHEIASFPGILVHLRSLMKVGINS